MVNMFERLTLGDTYKNMLNQVSALCDQHIAELEIDCQSSGWIETHASELIEMFEDIKKLCEVEND